MRLIPTYHSILIIGLFLTFSYISLPGCEEEKPKPAKTEPPKTEQVKTESQKTETAPALPGQTEPAQTQPAQAEPVETPSTETKANIPSAKGAVEMAIKSKAFSDGQEIPRKYTGDGQDVSPPLAWSDLPAGTKELALICDDPDAPTPQPWVHWVIYKIPADAMGLAEGIPQQEKLTQPAGVLQGKNSWPSGNIGYRGPAPPKGHGVHHYHFKLYALDAPLNAPPGLDKEKLIKAMQGHILAQTELLGTYKR